MNNFTFSNPVKIIFGKNTIGQISAEIPSVSRVLLIYGGGSIKGNGVYDQIIKALEGYSVIEFSGITANPEYETCLNAVNVIRKEKIDFILAAGGGSVIDATKFIALASETEGDPWDIPSKHIYPSRAIPFGTILTLPATGSEMNCGAVISRTETNDKLAFGTPIVYPKFSVLDPETTYSLPKRQIANGVIDTFVHTTEQYLTYPVGGALQDNFAESILKVLLKYGERALMTPENYEVRANLMWASTWGLNGWIAQGVPEDWATHMIGHEITALYGIDHGQTLAIVLPGLLNVCRKNKAEKIIQMGERVFGIAQGNIDERIDSSIRAIESFFKRMGSGTRLSDFGLDAEAAKKVAEKIRQRGWTLGENNDIDAGTVEKILIERI